MRNIWTIARREYKAYYSTFTVYLFAFFILMVIGGVVTASLLFTINSFGSTPPPGVQVVTGPLIFMLIFTCPAFTMRLISEEARLGTIELLLTAPVRDYELVVGKWLGSFLFVLTLISLTWIYPILLNLIVDPGIDQGPLVSGYLGLVLAGGAFLAIGIAISSFFANQVASYITTFGVIVLFWWIMGIGGQVASGNIGTIFQYLDMASHFYDHLYQGVIQASSIIYYLSLTAAALVLGAVSVETRRWR
jgi:ABC-2 type transport system permease protein